MSNVSFCVVTLQVLGNTPKALLCTDDGEREFWLPRSQLREPDPAINAEWSDLEAFDPELHALERCSTVAMPEWLARDKELI